MPGTITPVAGWTSVTAISDGDALNQTNLRLPAQALANRTEAIAAVTPGVGTAVKLYGVFVSGTTIQPEQCTITTGDEAIAWFGHLPENAYITEIGCRVVGTSTNPSTAGLVLRRRLVVDPSDPDDRSDIYSLSLRGADDGDWQTISDKAYVFPGSGELIADAMYTAHVVIPTLAGTAYVIQPYLVISR